MAWTPLSRCREYLTPEERAREHDAPGEARGGRRAHLRQVSPVLPVVAPPLGVLLSTVEPERVHWLGYPRFPSGKLMLLEGDPGEGKTAIMIDLAARVSTGRPLPGSAVTRRPAGVVLLSAEDDLSDTIVPRLTAAGADRSRIISESLAAMPSLDAGGLDHIRRLIDRVDACFVAVDPLSAFIPDYVNTHREHSTKRMLVPVVGLAAETGVLVCVTRHLTKLQADTPRNPRYAGIGTIAFTGTARVAHVVGPDPGDPSCKVFAKVKNNLAPDYPGLGYRLVSTPIRVGGKDIHTVTVEWLGEVDVTAAEVLKPPPGDSSGGGEALAEAALWLQALLATGPVSSKTVRDGATGAGLAWDTVKRAKKTLGVRATKEPGPKGYWHWTLPDQSAAREKEVRC